MHAIKILYIDSDSDQSKSCLHQLIEKGHEVKYVSSSKDALIECTFRTPDLIIFDPVFENDGFGLIKQIKENYAVCKTILYTEDISPETMSQTIALRIDGFVPKGKSLIPLFNQIEKIEIKKESTTVNTQPIFHNLGNDFIYESSTFYILHHTEKIALTTQESKLIDELVNAHGEYVSNEQLQNAIGKNETASIDTLRTVVRKIRKKTYDDIIQNQNALGYRININHDISIFTSNTVQTTKKFDINILIVKGEKQANDKIAYHLGKFGLSCESAYTKDQAKELLSHTFFDYIITDVDLPDGEGTDLVRELNAGKKIKFIILSDSSDIHYKDYLYFKGILDYVIYKDNIEYLAQTIYKTIEKVESNTSDNHILLIEKSKKIYEQIKDLLRPRNYHIGYINDITQAYEIIKTNRFSLIICDIEFEQVFQLIANVKYNVNNLLPFMLLKNSGDNYALTREAYKNGANECLSKPILPEEFILKVDQHVEEYKHIKELIEQKRLMESYKNIVDQTTIFSKTDPEGIITYVNEMFCQVSKYSKDELVGQPHNIVRHPDVSKEVFEELWNTIKAKKIRHGILKNKDKNGDDYYVKTFILPICNLDGEIEEYIALRTEITHLMENGKEL